MKNSSRSSSSSTKSPLIRQLVYTFGFLGYQLTPIRAESQDRSLKKSQLPLTLLHNILFTAVVFYVLVEPSYDPYYVELNLREINKYYKPLLGTVVQLNMLIFYPLSHLLYKGHYAFYGRQIVQLLNTATEVFDGIFAYRPSRLWLIQAAVLLLLLTTYIFIDSDILQLTLAGSGEPITVKCLKLLATFSVYVDMFVTYGIVLLFKLAMRQRLCQMAAQMQKRAAAAGGGDFSGQGLLVKTNLKELHAGVGHIGRQLRRLASLHARHNQLLSFPFFVYVFSNTVDCVGLICLYPTDTSDSSLSLPIYLLIVFLSALYISYLDERSLHCFRLLLKQLRTLKASAFTSSGRVLSRTERSAGRSARIYLEELELYEHYLPLKLFGLCTLDYLFVICCGLLVVETSVMIIQTSHK